MWKSHNTTEWKLRIGGSNINKDADLKAELRQAPQQRDDPVFPGIIQDIVDALSVFRDPGSNHFLHYITTEDISKEFREGRRLQFYQFWGSLRENLFLLAP